MANVVERLRIEVSNGNPEGARALSEQIGGIIRDLWIPLIESVLDAADREDEVVRFDRLDLDLGNFARNDLAATDGRLRTVLEAALTDRLTALERPERDTREAVGGVSARPAGAALIDELEYYLVNGVWRYGSPIGRSTDPHMLYARLAEEEPAPLEEMLERNASSETVRLRLSRQVPNARLPIPAASSEPIFVANAGLVLVSPFLPELFSRLDVTTGGRGASSFRSADAAARAVHLLQYLADGRCHAFEPELVLNKILCGFDPSWPVGASVEMPVGASVEMTQAETAACDSLVGALIANWPSVDGTSTAGLQKSFFQREGRLDRSEGGWRLVVERMALDVLIDSLPWSFSTIFHPWMPGPLSVEW